jgi:putative transposase
MIKFKPKKTPSNLTFSFYDNNQINHLFYSKLCVESKKVFNLSIFCTEIFNLYKGDIFKYILELHKNNINKIEYDYDEFIINKLIYYFDEYVKIKDIIKNNNSYIYKYIINYINQNNIIIRKNNFNAIYSTIIKNLLRDDNIKYKQNKKILLINIIYRIIFSIYNNNFNKIKNEMLDHKPFTINDNDLIEEIKNNDKYQYKAPNDIKIQMNDLLYNKLKSNQNYISRFVYKKLGDSTKNLQSTMILAVIKKVFESYTSYYELLKIGRKANKPKFLQKNEKFNLIYFYSDIVVDTKNKELKLYASENISKNFDKIFGNKYIYLENNKYINKKYLIKKSINEKIPKKQNYVLEKFYVNKNNKHIIDSRYIVIPMMYKINDKKVSKIEIKQIYGTYKIYYGYENNKISSEEEEIKIKDMISIDLGVNNLLTIYDPTGYQYIIKGGILKSLNYYTTKKIGKYQKYEKLKYLTEKFQKIRENKISNFFNKIVKWMEKRYSSKKLIIIGYNSEWKQKSNLGKKSNMIFNKIPYLKLINKIKMKFNVITTEESYTSKCDSLNFEKIEKKEIYSGSRLKRGLFSSAKKKLLNADINGAINIMRKQVNLDIITGKNICNPKIINIFHEANASG